MIARIAALLLVGILAAGAHVESLDVGPTGQDAVILVESSRVQTAGDLGARLTQELRQNIRPTTAFYRPLVNLTFAVDGLLARDSWQQLHRTSIAWHAAASASLLLLLLRLGFGLPWALGGAVLFALHPLAIEVVPAPARRGESMVTTLLCLSCALWPDGGSRRRVAGAVVVGVLAPLAKETGFLLPLLWGSLPSKSSWRRRIVGGVLAVLPALIARTMVLGGGGGYAGWSWHSTGLFDATLDLFDPFRLTTGWGARLILAAVLASGWWSWRRAAAGSRALPLAVMWLASSLAMLGMARGVAAWYLYLPAVGAVLLLVSVLRGLWDLSPRWAWAVAVAVLAFPWLRPSPLWTNYSEWELIGRESARVLRATDQIELLDALEPLVVAALPREVYLRPRPRFYVRSATGVVDDTLRAWLGMRSGREWEVSSWVDVTLDGPRSGPVRAAQTSGRYSTKASERCRLFAPPGIRFLPPMWPTKNAATISAGGSTAHGAIPSAGLWVWTGGEFVYRLK